MLSIVFEISEEANFESKALAWAQKFNQICYFNSNDFHDEYSSIDSFLAVDAEDAFVSNGNQTFEELQNFRTKYANKWLLGFFGYDLKNEIEDLETTYPNRLKFPNAYFFLPKITLTFRSNKITITSENPQLIFDEVSGYSTYKETSIDKSKLIVKKRFSENEYEDAFHKLIGHIKRGDIYEVNLCQEFFSENAIINPIQVYQKLNEVSPTPFSTFFKLDDKYILSASPERFLAKRGDTLISQPIKGTAPRGKTAQEDQMIIHELQNNPKEIAENVMIVDLVRNDLTRCAQPGTVAAERKLEVHSFQQVHQLISTVTCQKDTTLGDIEVIKNVFPPGSMTGAPKISAMKLCDRYENARRGVYSGTVGYFSPNGDFDFNVVIRTVLYNHTEKYLSFHTGGALTIDAQVDKEYKECLLKASAIHKTLDAQF